MEILRLDKPLVENLDLVSDYIDVSKFKRLKSEINDLSIPNPSQNNELGILVKLKPPPEMNSNIKIISLFILRNLHNIKILIALLFIKILLFIVFYLICSLVV